MVRLQRWGWPAAGLAALLAAGIATAVLCCPRNPGQALRVPGDGPRAAPGAGGPWPTPDIEAPSETGGLPFVTGIASDGRHFVDQYGRPILVRGDSPWALMTRLSPEDAQAWFDDRRRHGVNAAIMSLIGAAANGAPHDDGTTFDGLKPFQEGDILRWRAPYWERVTDYLRMAERNGITIMLYPIDGWTIGHSFVPRSQAQCERFGGMLAERFAGVPNIVWVSGGDYFPGRATGDLAAGSDVDHCIAAAVRGLRASGDSHLFSMQLGYDKSISTENPFWSGKVDWNFVYTYHPTYQAVLEAHARRPAIPAVLGEANYEGENNQPDTPPTTDGTVRRQVRWALTSGAAGEFAGSRDWKFDDEGWRERLDTPAQAQVARLRALFAGLPWWTLLPDTDRVQRTLVTGGRGTRLTHDVPLDVLDNDYVTAARSDDGRLAVVYVPSSRTITVDPTLLAGETTAQWVDPASGKRLAVPVSGTFTTPGRNAGGDQDWLLLFRAP